jgi:hypothetical protein
MAQEGEMDTIKEELYQAKIDKLEAEKQLLILKNEILERELYSKPSQTQYVPVPYYPPFPWYQRSWDYEIHWVNPTSLTTC